MSAHVLDLLSAASLDELLLETAVQGAVVLALALASLGLWRRASAAWRHFGLTIALVGTLGLPLLRLVTPALGLPGRNAPAGVEQASHGPTEVAVRESAVETPAEPALVAETRVSGFPGPSTRATPPATGVAPGVEGPFMQAWTSVIRSRLLFFVWLAGALVALLPMAIGRLRLQGWVRQQADGLGPAWSHTRDALAFSRPALTRLRFVDAAPGSMPMTWGVLRPTIALPADGASWPETRRRDVLLHEFAHVARRDCLTEVLGRIACAARWYDPLAWLALRRMRLERERACDDLVLRAGREAAGYAESLVAIARQARQQRVAAFAGLALARRSTLHARIGSLLARGHNRSGVTLRHGLATAFGVTAVLGSASALRARPATEEPRLPILTLLTIPSPPPAPLRSESGDAVVESRGERRVAEDARTAGLPPVPGISVRDVSIAPARSAASALRAPTFSVTAPAATQRQASAATVCDTSSAGNRRRGSNTSHSISSNRGERVWQVQWSSNGCVLVVQARGDVEWNADLTDVASLSRGGSITVESDDGRTVRRYVVRSRNGTLERFYTVDDAARPFDAEARAWLEAFLVALDRRTGFAADIRLPRMLAREGVDGALREIALVEGDYAQRIYYTRLLALRELSSGELQQALAATARRVGSDYEMAELLIAFAKARRFDAASYPAYVQALGTIGSSYELRRAASVMLARDDLPPDAVRGVLQAAAAIDSDYEKAELLVSMGRRYAMNDATRPIYVEALRSISGDYERRRVMETILRGGALDTATLRALVATTRDMRGDFEVGEVLLRLGRQGAATSATAEFFAATRQIRGDHEKSRVLAAVAGREDLTASALLELIGAAGTIKSDYECAQVLVAVARAHALGGEAREAYERAAATIDSDHEYGRALSALRRAR